MRTWLSHVALVLVLTCAVSSSLPAGAATSPTSARQMKAIVHAWSNRLNAGDNAGVAHLFALPSIVAQGSYAFRFHTYAQLAQWHSGLPCSGRVVSITVRGRNATVVFRLGNRGATHCDAPGTLAAARFEIVNGKIVLWQQVPVPEKKPSGPSVI
jgi:hypothetical protein